VKLPYKNPIPVAGHRGVARYFPENTLVGFEAAIELGCDMVENDVHMTKDGELVLMHDHKVDRTTNGEGLISEMTLEQVKALDAGAWKDPKFAGTRVPTLREFCELFSGCPDMLFNIELKDYPAMIGERAFESARKAIAMLDEFGYTDRCVINTWSGELNEWIHAEYGRRVRIHAYSPQEVMGLNQRQYLYNYAYCVCMWGDGAKVASKRRYDTAKACGVETWAYYGVDTPELYEESLANGAELFTSNDPKWAMEYLKNKGLHN